MLISNGKAIFITNGTVFYNSFAPMCRLFCSANNGEALNRRSRCCVRYFARMVQYPIKSPFVLFEDPDLLHYTLTSTKPDKAEKRSTIGASLLSQSRMQRILDPFNLKNWYKKSMLHSSSVMQDRFLDFFNSGVPAPQKLFHISLPTIGQYAILPQDCHRGSLCFCCYGGYW
jgi:hypothetical protein